MKQFWSSTGTRSGRKPAPVEHGTSFCFFCFFYIMCTVHSLSLLLFGCDAPERFSGYQEFYRDNCSVVVCGWTVALRKRSLCSCHDPLRGSYLRLQLLNTSDPKLNAALSASSPYILITREEAECPFSDVNDHFSPEGKKGTFRCLRILQKSGA